MFRCFFTVLIILWDFLPLFTPEVTGMLDQRNTYFQKTAFFKEIEHFLRSTSEEKILSQAAEDQHLEGLFFVNLIGIIQSFRYFYKKVEKSGGKWWNVLLLFLLLCL